MSCCRRAPSRPRLTPTASTALAAETQASYKLPVRICPRKKRFGSRLQHENPSVFMLTSSPCPPACWESPVTSVGQLTQWPTFHGVWDFNGDHHAGQMASLQAFSLTRTLTNDLEVKVSLSLSHINSSSQLAAKEVTWQETNFSISPNLAKTGNYWGNFQQAQTETLIAAQNNFKASWIEPFSKYSPTFQPVMENKHTITSGKPSHLKPFALLAAWIWVSFNFQS